MKHKDAHGLESIEALVHDRDIAVTLCNAAEVTIERLRSSARSRSLSLAEIERLRSDLELRDQTASDRCDWYG
jgi:hypothetical protein